MNLSQTALNCDLKYDLAGKDETLEIARGILAHGKQWHPRPVSRTVVLQIAQYVVSHTCYTSLDVIAVHPYVKLALDVLTVLFHPPHVQPPAAALSFFDSGTAAGVCAGVTTGLVVALAAG